MTDTNVVAIPNGPVSASNIPAQPPAVQNKPSLFDVLKNIDNLGNLATDLRTFFEAEGKTFGSTLQTLEQSMENFVKTCESHVNNAEAALAAAKLALESANAIRSAVKSSFTDSIKSIENLMGLK